MIRCDFSGIHQGRSASRKLIFLLFFVEMIVSLTFFAGPAAAEIYTYIDRNGNTVITDDVNKIPENQRPKAQQSQDRQRENAPPVKNESAGTFVGSWKEYEGPGIGIGRDIQSMRLEAGGKGYLITGRDIYKLSWKEISDDTVEMTVTYYSGDKERQKTGNFQFDKAHDVMYSADKSKRAFTRMKRDLPSKLSKGPAFRSAFIGYWAGKLSSSHDYDINIEADGSGTFYGCGRGERPITWKVDSGDNIVIAFSDRDAMSVQGRHDSGLDVLLLNDHGIIVSLYRAGKPSTEIAKERNKRNADPRNPLSSEYDLYAVSRSAKLKLKGCAGLKQDVAEGVKLLRTSAQLGHAEDQFLLADILFFGTYPNVERNREEGLKWFKESAQNGNVEAIVLLERLENRNERGN